MKSFISTLLAVLISQLAFGQNLIERHFSTYLEQEDVAQVHVSGKMFEMATHLEIEESNEDIAELKEFVGTIKDFNLIVKHNLERPRPAYESALAKVQKEYDELMSVKEHDGVFTFFVNESNGIVRELVMVAMGPKELVVFSLEGNMELDQILKMASIIQQDKFSDLEKLEENGFTEIKLYPNPAQNGENITLEVPESLDGAQVSLIGLKGGEAVRQTSVRGNKATISTNGLAEGVYIVVVKTETVSIKKRVSVR